METDARLAECLLLQGDDSEALAMADETLTRLAGLGGAPGQTPFLQRIRGLGFAQLGDFAAAHAALGLSLRGAQERGARHEAAWTMHAMLTIGRAQGMSADANMAAEQASLFEQLGIVSVAEPRIGVRAADLPVPLARQGQPASAELAPG